MTPLTLVLGGRAGEREAAIAAVLTPGVACVVIVEGLGDGNSPLADLAAAGGTGAGFGLVRIAPGCLCCAGNLILRVTLNRILRHPPAQMFISVANGAHVEQLRLWLSQTPYDQFLKLGSDITAGSGA